MFICLFINCWHFCKTCYPPHGGGNKFRLAICHPPDQGFGAGSRAAPKPLDTLQIYYCSSITLGTLLVWAFIHYILSFGSREPSKNRRLRNPTPDQNAETAPGHDIHFFDDILNLIIYIIFNVLISLNLISQRLKQKKITLVLPSWNISLQTISLQR